MSNDCKYCTGAAHDLITARATANRIRIEAQQQLTHVRECLAVTLTEAKPEEWIAVCDQYIRYVIRDLDKLPRN
jgi:hypothetical protein